MIDEMEQAAENKTAFERIAPYYDMLMEGVPYRFWVKYLHTLWKHHKIEPLTVLDLACGTGTVALMLSREGYVVTGVDISHAMLDCAVDKAASAGLLIEFQCQDASDLSFEEKQFDAAISLFDSLNNIIDSDQLQECFRRVCCHLLPGGVFIFDVNTAFAFQQGMFDQKSRPSDGPLQYNWTSTYDKNTSICEIIMRFSYRGGGSSVQSFEEVHLQRAYETKDLVRMLVEGGFAHVAVYDAYSLSPAKRRSDRIFLVATVGKKK